MRQADIAPTIKKFIVENFLYSDEAFPLADTDSLIQANVIDSRGILEFIFFLEEQFGVRMADDEVTPENLDSIASIVAYVNSKQAQAAA